MLIDLHSLPKVRDSVSSLYVEHVRVDRHDKSIAVHDVGGMTPVPAAALCVLMLGPGTSVTQAAMMTLAENNCLVIWCGEENVRFYAYGTGGTRSGAPMLHQARLVSDERLRLEVVMRMYRMRFPEPVDDGLTVEQLRGMEGSRVRRAYAQASAKSGVPWTGRNYDRGDWYSADPANRALSAANACLYGICQAAILSCGYSPTLGFIHTGKHLSFVYDIADLYKVEMTVPVAFEMSKGDPKDLERRVRHRMRDTVREQRLLQRIVPDIQAALGRNVESEGPFAADDDPARPTSLWTPESQRSEEDDGAADEMNRAQDREEDEWSS